MAQIPLADSNRVGIISTSTKGIHMVSKSLTSIAVLALAAASFALPASAATTVKSGQICSKVNLVKKVWFSGETYVYKCVKNPMYKKTRLTWTLQECLTAISDYKKAKTAIDSAKAAGNNPSEIDTQLFSMAKDLRDMSCDPGI